MFKYSKKDIELVLDRYYNYSRRPVVSEFLREKVLKIAKEHFSEDAYESLYPYTAIWKINSDCNLRCKHCYFYGTEQYSTQKDLSFDEICGVINQLSELGITEIRLTGGEVFMQKDIFQLLRYIKSKNISVIITTNATLITDKIAKELADILSPQADLVRISLDGGTASTHDYTRGKGVFDKAINSIKMLKNNNIRVFIASVITSKNVQELPVLYNLLNDLEVEQFTLIKIVPIDISQKELVPSFEDMVYYSAEMYRQVKADDNITIDNRLFAHYDFLQDENARDFLYNYIELKGLQKVDLEIHCNADKSFYIDADGEVYLCPLAADYKIASLGNLKKDSLHCLFEKRSNNKLFKKKNCEQTKCKECKIFSLCKRGCFMKPYIYGSTSDTLPCNI